MNQVSKIRYSGTVAENFKNCAVVVNGRIVLDKSRDSKLMPNVYATNVLYQAYGFGARIACQLADDADADEIILEGEVSDDPNGDRIPVEIPFFVTKVWTHKSDVDPHKVRCGSDEELAQFVESHDPQQFYRDRFGKDCPLEDS